MIDYKNLTDEELLEFIDLQDIESQEMIQIRNLIKDDIEFKDRILRIRYSELIRVSERKIGSDTLIKENDDSSIEGPGIQWVIDDLNKLLNTYPVGSTNHDKVQAKIDYYTTLIAQTNKFQK